MAQPVEIDVNTIQYYDGAGNPIGGTSSGTGSGSGGGSGTGTGWLAGLLGAIPGILSALFPSGVSGNGSNQQYPYVSTLPNGQQQVTLAGSNNNIIMIVLVAMVAYLIFTGKQPIRAKK
jgi:hypothetical protein